MVGSRNAAAGAGKEMRRSAPAAAAAEVRTKALTIVCVLPVLCGWGLVQGGVDGCMKVSLSFRNFAPFALPAVGGRCAPTAASDVQFLLHVLIINNNIT